MLNYFLNSGNECKKYATCNFATMKMALFLDLIEKNNYLIIDK